MPQQHLEAERREKQRPRAPGQMVRSRTLRLEARHREEPRRGAACLHRKRSLLEGLILPCRRAIQPLDGVDEGLGGDDGRREGDRQVLQAEREPTAC
eukprot:CAMPEP_0182810640 /NCGR_PEP_ID=MMETSP0006_2-20121128/7846_1 /TAXON_ID=97485 /ORGANISM="Prymnesium parvum, Strain Texoma1" /LENGTH=96 /DNA_ID=CAMNT_0024936547 /DNA_START=336 /DNA_END=623 /DNA_ORIENTATION=+